MKRTARPPVVAFLGPSLPADQAAALGRFDLRPPAQRGDVWRAVQGGARVIALIDGLFERTPSVWHREIVDALESGVAVLGAASMGALRAAELARFGMIGVGTIFADYASGALIDDADVALVHADAELGFLPLSVPQVTVRWNLERARSAGVLTRAQARRVEERSRAIFYPDRVWPAVLEAGQLPEATRRQLGTWLEPHLEDPKALDARACLRAATALASSWQSPPRAPRGPRRSSLVRRVRLLGSVSGARAVAARTVLEALASQEHVLTDAGLRRALIAGWARESGLRASAAELTEWTESWREGLGAATVDEALRESGLCAAELEALLEDALLESRVLRHAARMVSDGPSRLEAFASEARLTGAWAAVVRKRR